VDHPVDPPHPHPPLKQIAHDVLPFVREHCILCGSDNLVEGVEEKRKEGGLVLVF